MEELLNASYDPDHNTDVSEIKCEASRNFYNKKSDYHRQVNRRYDINYLLTATGRKMVCVPLNKQHFIQVTLQLKFSKVKVSYGVSKWDSQIHKVRSSKEKAPEPDPEPLQPGPTHPHTQNLDALA